MPPNIRRATVEDVPAIRVLEQQAATAAHWRLEEYERRVGSGVIFVAEQDGQLCGFVCARVAASEWELENIVVVRGLLRRGVADSLMRALREQAVRAEASKIFLEVRESNRPARQLYEKHGFREIGRRRGYYRDPAEDAILYACSLAQG